MGADQRDAEKVEVAELKNSKLYGVTPAKKLIVFWGVFGVILLLLQALYRLTPIALEPIINQSLSTFQVLIYITWVVVNGYIEGYRAFQKKFCPRVIARAFWLGKNPRFFHVLLAPAFCMSLFFSTRRRLIASWVLLIAIIGLVLMVRALSQPWRGIIDGGVVVGLGWGVLVLIWGFFHALAGNPILANPDLPVEVAEQTQESSVG